MGKLTKPTWHDFNEDPSAASDRLARLLLPEPELAAQVLDDLLYQYSTLSLMAQLDESMSSVVGAIIKLPALQKEPSWSALYSWVNHRAVDRKQTFLEVAVVQGILFSDNDWLCSRMEQMSHQSKVRLASKIPQMITGSPPLPSLFQMGGVLVKALRTPSYAFGVSQPTLLSALDGLIDWGGRDFSLLLSPPDRSFLASWATRPDMSEFANIRSLAIKFAIDQSMKNGTPHPEPSPANTPRL